MPVALSALAVGLLCLFSGCDRGEPATAVAPTVAETSESAVTDPPEVYMKDPVFLKQLEVQKKARNRLLAKRCKIDEALQAEKAKNPASPKVKELQAALDAADGEFESNRVETLAIVRTRLMRKKGETK